MNWNEAIQQLFMPPSAPLPIHSACTFICQKEAKIGERCANSCELAPFAQELIDHQQQQVQWGQEHGYYPPPTLPLASQFDDETGQCELCDQLPSACTCAVVPRGAPPAPIVVASGHVTLGTPPPPPLAPVVINEPAKRINVRAKGQRGERQVIGLLQAVIDRIRANYHAEPIVLQRNALQAHLGGCDLHGLDGFAVEVKHVEVEAVSQWWRQTVRQAQQLATHGVPHVPVLFYRASHKPWRVKFRAYVQTPRDRDLIELDIETELAEFLEWFENAYDELMLDWLQSL